MGFRPLYDRVVVRRVGSDEKTAGGIIIPDTAQEKPSEGEVVSVGPGATNEDGKTTPMGCEGGRPRSVRQMVGYGSIHRWRRASHYEGVRHHGCDRSHQEEGQKGRLTRDSRKDYKNGCKRSQILNTGA